MWWVFGCLLVGSILLLFVRLCCLVVTVQGSSMEPTFVSGDRVLALRHYPSRLLRRGQIVVVAPWYPGGRLTEIPEHTLHLKRITQIAGDRITAALPETEHCLAYQHLRMLHEEQRRHGSWTIPARHLYVQGDNAVGSIDSTTYGPLPVDRVVGVMIASLSRTEAVTEAPITSLERLRATCEGQPVPAFALSTDTGQLITSASYLGRTVCLLFSPPETLGQRFATTVMQLAQHMDTSDFQFVLLCPDPMVPLAIADRPAALTVVPLSSLTDPRIAAFHVDQFPTYYLVNPAGTVTDIGNPTWTWGRWKEYVTQWTNGQFVPPPGLP